MNGPMIDQYRQPEPVSNRQMMGALQIPGRMPKAPGMQDQETLQSIFSSLPPGSMLKALEAIGIAVREPQEALADDDGQNQLPSWNDRRIMLDGQDQRGPIWDRNKVIEVPLAMTNAPQAPYLAPDYNAGMGPLSVNANAQGGM
jgi:hypothetical protein